MRFRVAEVAAILAVVVAVQVAEAQTFRIAVDAPERLAPLTGAEGSRTVRIDAPTAGLDSSPVLMVLVVDEQRDRPCFVRAKFGGAGGPIYMPDPVNLCPGGIASVLGQAAGVVELPWYYAAREAAVCLNKNGGRVKGLRLVGQRLGGNAEYPDETFLPGIEMREFKLPNCYSWSRPSACASQEAATGVVLHFREEGRGRTFPTLSGLQLVCRAAT